MNIVPALKLFLKTSKGKVVAASSGTVVAVGIGAAVILQGGGYRSIAVEAVTGIVNVIGERNNGEAYVGENLYSGDDISVMDASELTMCMDGDKYVYADANTHFTLEASDKSEDSRIKIHLDAGSELNVLENKLGANESYEVDTPNSTMSVRGTKFRVTVYKGSDGLIYTLNEVEEGQVLVRLKTTDGSYNGVEQLFTPGQSAFIRGNNTFSEFIMTGMLDSNDLENGDDDSDKLKLAYDNLPEDGMERLIALLDKMDETEPEKPAQQPTEEEPVEEEPEEEEPEEEPEEEESALNIPLADTQSVFEQMYDAAVTGTDPDTGYLILSDGTLFDPDYYARNNPDVVDQFGSDPEDLLAHYLIFGKDENRAPSEQAAENKEEQWKAFSRMLEEDAAGKARLAAEEEARKNALLAPANTEEDNSNSGGSQVASGGGGGIVNPFANQINIPEIMNGSYDPNVSVAHPTFSNPVMPATVTDGNGNTVNLSVTSNGAASARMIIDSPANIKVPFQIDDSTVAGSFITVQGMKNIEWEHTASGVTVRDGSGNTVQKYSDTQYVYTDGTGSTTYSSAQDLVSALP